MIKEDIDIRYDAVRPWLSGLSTEQSRSILHYLFGYCCSSKDENFIKALEAEKSEPIVTKYRSEK